MRNQIDQWFGTWQFRGMHRGWKLILCAFITCILVSCSQGPSPYLQVTPMPATQLQLPGVTQIPGIDALERRLGTVRIDSVTTYTPEEAHGVAQVLFSIHEGELYDVGLDGSDLHRLALTTPCFAPKVTPDGHWVACITPQGIALASLQAGQIKSEHEVVHVSGDNPLNSLAWSPDGQQLAAVSLSLSESKVALYTEQSEHSSLRLRAMLTLPGSLLSPGEDLSYEVYWLTWSPDGRFLLFAARLSGGSVYLLPLSLVPPASLDSNAPPYIATLSSDQLTFVSRASRDVTPVWSPFPNVITLNNTEMNSLEDLNIASGKQGTILTIQSPGLNVCQPSWTSAGHALVFSLCEPPTVEYPASVLQPLYVYRPQE